MLIKRYMGQIIYILLKSFFRKRNLLSYSDAYKMLMDFSKKPNGSALTNNKIQEKYLYDLQIIIPCYNVEKYIVQCLESIIHQNTTHNIIVTIIDDGSTDRTGELIKTFQTNDNIEVITQVNKGHSGARNAALKKIKAQNIMFVDSDDFLFDGCIETLLNVINEGYDLVEGNSKRLVDGKLFNHVSHKNTDDNIEQFSGFPWLKIFNSKLFKDICFPEGYWYEDTIIKFLIYPRVKAARGCNIDTYIYRFVPSSVSNTGMFKPKVIDTFWITELVLETAVKLNYTFDSYYLDLFFEQVICNYLRTKIQPEEIKSAIFTCELFLYNKYFFSVKSNRFLELQRIFDNKNYSRYKLYCTTHR